MIEVFVLPLLGAVYVAWDLGSDWIKAQKSAHDLSSVVEQLRAENATLSKRCSDAEKQAHDTKNKLAAAEAAVAQRTRRWDSARPVKIG